MKNLKFTTITCPHCGYEYLPAEIFVPNSFFGKPFNIVRTKDGKIFDYMGTSLDVKESFNCTHCDKDFNVSTRIMFISMKSEDEISEFEEEYSSPINKEALILDEEKGTTEEN